jgi:hypothetical protein
MLALVRREHSNDAIDRLYAAAGRARLLPHELWDRSAGLIR